MPRIDHQLAPNYGPPLLPLIDQNGITPHRKWRRMFAVIDQKKKGEEEGQEGKKGDTTYRYGVRNFCHGNDKLYPGEQ